MKGFYVPRRFGWDCHGLPVENEIEKAKELSGSSAIETFGINKFNEECRSIVLRYTSEWEKTVSRMGRWVDFDKTYKTMDPTFMESVWWVFHELYKKSLVYEGFKVMPFSTKLGTPLSNFEANLNYQDVDDPSITVAFELTAEPNTFFLAWTTTPWTLPSNLALMVQPDAEYVKVKDPNTSRHYILAKPRISLHFKIEPEIVKTYLGKELKGVKYKPLFPYFKEHKQKNAFQILTEDTVSMDDGTGVVHTAPAFGELDFFVCNREGIEPVCPVDSNGRFTSQVPPYEGVYVKEADKGIIKELKANGSLFHQATIRHRYPFCWRSDTPLIYKTVRTWFVSVEKIKQDLLDSNEQIQWMPKHLQKGRFGKWLENARDWAISRNRYWGTPIPIWRSECGNIHVVQSIKELESLTGEKISDLHRHFIDDLSFEKEGKIYKRIPEVFDCWFESGSAPYAQNHYPFEKTSEFEKGFPADFIAEGIDQTRGWFYTLTILSSALFKKPAFKNVIVNGIILAEDGNKMSKRLKNYPDPELLIDEVGADAVRLYLLGSPAVRAEDLRFSKKGVEQTLRQVMIPMWNSFVFLSTYAKIYNWKPQIIQKKPNELIDEWILSITQKLILEVDLAMENYDLNKAVDPFISFIDELTNWYIRRCRGRFWADQDTQDRREAFSTLYTVLISLSKVSAPFIPFLSEAIYQELKTEGMEESVHLCAYPQYDNSLRSEDLENQVSFTQTAVNLGHSLRKEHKLKVRQTLAKAYLISSNPSILKSLEKHKEIIADELNVKEVVLLEDESRFVMWAAKPNFPILGKKIGSLMPQAKKLIENFCHDKIISLSKGGSFKIKIGEIEVEITPEDVSIERKVKEGLAAGNSGEITVALDTKLNEELIEEGIAREIVNKINTLRKEKNFQVTDRISVAIQTTDKIQKAFTKYYDYIVGEILALSVSFENCNGSLVDINGEASTISLSIVF